MKTVLLVGLGGALGAIARYLVSLIPLRGNFPTGPGPLLTLTVNLFGALLIGFLVGTVTARPSFPAAWTAFFKTGVCGGFTTFSTFSLETLMLLESGKILAGIFYGAASVCFCIVGVLAGRALAALLFQR